MSKFCEEPPLPTRPTLDAREDNKQLAAYDERLATLHAEIIAERAKTQPLEAFLKFLNTGPLNKLSKAIALLRSKNTPETDLRLRLLNTHLKLYKDYHDELSKCKEDGPKKRQSFEIIAEAALTGEQAMFQAYLRDHANGLTLEKIDKTNRTLALVALKAFVKLHPELSHKMPLEIIHKIMGNKDGNMVTIDDGPNELTPQILAILAESGVCAIFYLLGENVSKYPEHTRAIVNQGHIIGYHSMNHEKGDYYTPETLESDFVQFQQALNKALGSSPESPYPVAFVRMPYGTSFSYTSYTQKAKDSRSTLHGTAYLPMGNGTPRDCNWDIHDGSFRGKGWTLKDTSAKANHYRDRFKKGRNQVFLLHQDQDDVAALRTMLLSNTAEYEKINLSLDALFYQNATTLTPTAINHHFSVLKSAVDRGVITLAEVQERVVPPNDFSYALYLSSLAAESVAPTRLRELEGDKSRYASKLRSIFEKAAEAKKTQKICQMVLAKFTETFGKGVDWEKRSWIFPEEANINVGQFEEGDHSDAIDIFYKGHVLTEGNSEIGPPIMAYAPGVVIAASDNWNGETTPDSYEGGGLSPVSGNGVIIFNPKSGAYFAYYHLHHLSVKKGDIVRAGDVLGRGGNTGIRAKQSGHGEHLHFEIHKYNPGSDSVEILYWDLIAKLLKEARGAQVATR